MSSPCQFLEDAVAAAKRAVEFDQNRQIDPAVYFYMVSSQLLLKAAQLSSEEKAVSLRQKANEYKKRANTLETEKNCIHISQGDENTLKLKRFRFLMQQALDADAAEIKDTAIELYTNAIEFITKNPELMQGEVKGLAIQALERAETLKGIKNEVSEVSSPPPSNISNSVSSELDNKSLFTNKSHSVPVTARPNLHRGSSISLTVSGRDTYSEEEKLVLCRTSVINRREYVPFMHIDLSEKFQYAIPFTDKDGYLTLSPKQKRDFFKWVRPDEISKEPCIVCGNNPDYFSIKQTIVSDCSFVASLAVSASYEKRFGKKIVTAIIYPRSKDKKPLCNPFGKYMIKLHLNGITRKVIIDDYLPMNKYGQLLCSYSSNKNEFWISLLEKAYMKVMGGYDFPGSNSVSIPL